MFSFPYSSSLPTNISKETCATTQYFVYHLHCLKLQRASASNVQKNKRTHLKTTFLLHCLLVLNFTLTSTAATISTRNELVLFFLCSSASLIPKHCNCSSILLPSSLCFHRLLSLPPTKIQSLPAAQVWQFTVYSQQIFLSSHNVLPVALCNHAVETSFSVIPKLETSLNDAALHLLLSHS